MHTTTKLSALIAATFVAGSAQATTIAQLAAEDPRLSTLATAVEAAGLSETLDGPGKFTLYAPTDAAFDDLPAGSVEVLLGPLNADRLEDVLLYHIDDRLLRTLDFPQGPNHFRTMNTAERLCITADGGELSIADGSGDLATVIVADIIAENGVIHLIDKVLLPGTRPKCH